MINVVIADNLVNDYCGFQSHFTWKNVNIGRQMIGKTLGVDKDFGKGPLIEFLNHQKTIKNTSIIYFRDAYTDDNQIHMEYLERLGEHCIKGTVGADFIDPVKELAEHSVVLDCAGLTFPLGEFRKHIQAIGGFDIFEQNNEENKKEIQFLLTGFHTERRIFTTANILKNLFAFKNVAVFSHFLASANKESHFTSLRYQFPDSLIRVLNGIDELEEYLDQDLSFLHRFGLGSVDILPKQIKDQLMPEQKDIIEAICMHWTEAELKQLSGGFSGSALFLANGKQGSSRTEPMVIKIDKHYPIRLEIKGYNLVKDFLGKHIPTFTFPVSNGEFTGIGMELASMEGNPSTLQDYFEEVVDDYGLDKFLKLLERSLSMLCERVYSNTLDVKRVAPFRHFMLHIGKQSAWLEKNIENIQRHKNDQVDIFPEVLIKIFNLVRKNDDGLQSEMCIAHGDLNFANVIADSQGNLWAIDWTHANLHPLEIDFAKMENDLKFVLSKELLTEDLSKLQILEDYLLSTLNLPVLADLPANIQFVRWDLRFKKIYLAIRKLREYLNKLKNEDSWVVYKIALLRYALHTLSFDKSTGGGECSPAQLWYALLSVSGLLFELVADDYHLKIRSEKPDNYPARFRIQIDMANWNVPCPEYDPPYFVSEQVLANSRTDNEKGFADPEEEWSFKPFIDWGRPYPVENDGKPLNPSGRTGIVGRGNLGLWGCNPMLFIVPIRHNSETNQLQVLISRTGDSLEIISVHMRRNEALEEAIQRGKEKTGEIEGYIFTETQEGYLYDPRQTDNAWVDAKAFLLYWDDVQAVTTPPDSSEKVWENLDHEFINKLYSSHGSVIRKAVLHIYEKGLNKQDFVAEILDKTG